MFIYSVRNFFYAAILSSVFLMGCKENDPKTNDQAGEIPSGAVPMDARGGNLVQGSSCASTTQQFFRNGENVYAVQWKHSYEKNEPDVLILARLDEKANALESYPVARGAKFSNILEKDNRFLTTSVEGFVDDDGRLWADIQLYEIQFDGQRPYAELRKEFRSELRNVILEVDEHEKITAEKYRSKYQDVFNTYFTPQFGIYPPELILDTNGDVVLFVNDWIEAFLVNLNTKSVISVKKLDPRMSFTPRLSLCSGNDGQYVFALSGDEYLLDPYLNSEFRKNLNVSDPNVEKGVGILLSVDELGNQNLLHEFEFPNSTLLSIDKCWSDGQTYYAAGDIRFAVPYEHDIFIAKWNDGETNLKTFDLEKNSSIHSVLPLHGREFLYAGGDFNFTQASTGSVSHGDGFILGISLTNMNALPLVPLHGKRSTITRTIWEDPVSGLIYVGGTTDGPDTHSKDSSEKAFQFIFDPTINTETNN